MTVLSSSSPGTVTAQPRAKSSADNPAANTLLSVYGAIPLGTDGQVLTADSTQTLGVRWATAGGAQMADVYANRPAASAALNGLTFFATDKLMLWECVAGAWVLVVAYAPLVAALPPNPIDGQECLYQADAANGINWRLRYNAGSASAHKWEAGGASLPLFSEIVTDEALPVGGGWRNFPTVGPSVTPPLAGDYFTQVSAGRVRSSVAGVNVWMSYSIGGVDPGVGGSSTDGAQALIQTTNEGWTMSREQRKNDLAAGAALQARYETDSGTAVISMGRRSLSCVPVRVGP